MPLIRPRHVLSFSSEDAAQPAQNLLKSETYRKWRCATAGEKQASVILELEKATQIHSIDIGNNGSALVEVLVGRSSWSSEEQFQVLLVASSFMSPAESKSFTNTNRVRMFGADKLSKPVAAQKWDRVKLVCTQPFNKNEQYGLSFINLHSPPDDTDGDSAEKATASPSVTGSKRLGRFTLRDDSDSEEKKVSSGSLFFKTLQKKASPPPMSTAAEVRAASTAATSSDDRKPSADSSVQGVRHPVAKDRGSLNKDRQPVAKDGHPAKDRVEKIGGKASPKPDEKPIQRRTSESTKWKYEDSPKENKKNKSPPPAKKKRESPNHDDSSVSFDEIMKGVVFVMSGFVNPERGNLRDKALQMGAQYRQDWGKGCTHLICAFANTPKFNQVKGKGKIVTKKWITDCFKKNKRLPTRNYHLSGDSSSSEDSSEEEEVKTKPPPAKKTKDTDSRDEKNAGTSDTELKDDTPSVSAKPSMGKTDEVSGPAEKKDEPKKIDDDDDIYGGSTDDEAGEPNQSNKTKKVSSPLSPKETSSSDRDTEDELKRVQEEEVEDIYGGSTDDEQEDTTKKDITKDETEDNAESADDVTSGSEDLPSLPDFFSHKHFMLYGEVDSKTRRLLIRYITAYNGTVEDYMSDTVDFVITMENWDKNFDEALDENPSLAFVRPKWIMACHEKGAFVPFQPYIIVPS
ncbi:DNA repair protein XRCC1-like [Oculina patagonica]